MIDRIPLAHLPTPIQALPGLTKLLGGPRLFIKRDDLTGLGLGGNKTRKLEFLAADALAQEARMLISTGAPQSNHCRQVAAAAAQLGLGCLLVLAGEDPGTRQGNLLLDALSGAKIVFVPKGQRDAALRDEFERAQTQGQAPYLIPYGGSNALGAQGYALAMRELNEQALKPDWLVFASSSGGTQAGLVLGARETGFTGKILGISVDESAPTLQARVATLVAQASALSGSNFSVAPEEILVNDRIAALVTACCSQWKLRRSRALPARTAFFWTLFTPVGLLRA